VLVCGGGDGLAVREVLRHPEVERVVLVDLDPAMTELARDHEVVSTLNARSLHDPRVTVVNDDAMAWLEERRGLFDVALLDFPDPASFAVGKLYTTRFYERLLGSLAPDGVVACQATSILDTRKAFWCVAKTMETAGLAVRPYRAYVPSFHGDWGFVLASRRALPVPDRVPPGVRSLDPATMRGLFDLPPDLGPVDVEPNRLDTQVLVRYYEGGRWRTPGG
jgi:spermidine synthase